MIIVPHSEYGDGSGNYGTEVINRICIAKMQFIDPVFNGRGDLKGRKCAEVNRDSSLVP